MIEEAISLTQALVDCPSISGDEGKVVHFLADTFKSFGWQVELFEVEGERKNLFVQFGIPKIVFTTHTDVVPAPEALFTSTVKNDRIYGRGSCDAKGIIAAQVAAARSLLLQGAKDFGLLYVVDEEVNGIGAKHAAETLQGRGIQYIVNGEPTECKLATSHKGVLLFTIRTQGKAVHSGYPELGIDANATLIRALHRVLEADLGEDPILGKALINFGLLRAGTGSNILSPYAECTGTMRTVFSTEQSIQLLQNLLGEECSLEVSSSADGVRLGTLEGFPTVQVNYFTDIPNFLPLGATPFLYGPGSIHQAHTDDEYLEISQLKEAIKGYQDIFSALHTKGAR